MRKSPLSLQVTTKSKIPNAMTMGVPGVNLTMVTSGGKKAWSAEEMAAVLSHERGHVAQLHMPIKMGNAGALRALADHYPIVTNHPLAERIGWPQESMGGLLTRAASTHMSEAQAEMVRNVVKLSSTKPAQMLRMNALSYGLERSADTYAIRKGHGLALASALEKIEGSRSRGQRVNSLVRGLMQGQMHPGTTGRVARARRLAAKVHRV